MLIDAKKKTQNKCKNKKNSEKKKFNRNEVFIKKYKKKNFSLIATSGYSPVQSSQHQQKNTASFIIIIVIIELKFYIFFFNNTQSKWSLETNAKKKSKKLFEPQDSTTSI